MRNYCIAQGMLFNALWWPKWGGNLKKRGYTQTQSWFALLYNNTVKPLYSKKKFFFLIIIFSIRKTLSEVTVLALPICLLPLDPAALLSLIQMLIINQHVPFLLTISNSGSASHSSYYRSTIYRILFSRRPQSCSVGNRK